jgi:hypothetical protein
MWRSALAMLREAGDVSDEERDVALVLAESGWYGTLAKLVSTARAVLME